ncbi:MAG TPA: DUF5666 domain-containing protein [Longimicrobium sp.]|nr:DUF5666 domain-containing protein [Longimicrobium sp.]
MRIRWMVPAMVLAACGGGEDGAAVEGTFAPGLAPTGVWVVESERSEPADSAGFQLADLTPGPVSLRLMNGADTAGVLNLSGLASGARLRLEGLRVDPESGMAFPRTVQLDGGDMVTVNGLRMASASRIPRQVDVRGAVLAWSSDAGALLVRPDEPRLPDLRVVVGPATQLVGEDGGGADATMIEPGDSVRVEGRSDDGYVVASRITVPTRIAAPGQGDDDAAVDQASEDDDGGGDAVDRIPQGGSATPAPVVAAPPRRSATPAPVVSAPPGRANHPGRGRGHAKGRGKGKG